MAAELDRLSSALALRDAPLTLWWRDDDAGAADPRLGRLLSLAERASIPLALAVIPARLEPGTIDKVAAHPTVTVAQHGWSHANHGAPGERKIELGGKVNDRDLIRSLAFGYDLLTRTFGSRVAPVIVPPWNRFAERLEVPLENLGFRAVSGLASGAPRRGLLPRIDVHLDAMQWRPAARWLGLGDIVGRLCRLLAAGASTIGLMTHHLRMNENDFEELQALLRFLAERPEVRIVGLGDLLETARSHVPA